MKLTFDANELRTIAAKLKKSSVKARDLDGRKIGKGFWLVGDEGVYLMGNGVTGKGKLPHVVYADQCNPKKQSFDSWWDVKRRSFGGDDGAEFIALEDMEKHLNIGAAKLIIWLTPQSMKIETRRQAR